MQESRKSERYARHIYICVCEPHIYSACHSLFCCFSLKLYCVVQTEGSKVETDDENQALDSARSSFSRALKGEMHHELYFFKF